MAELFASGRVVEAILAFMSIECALLLWVRKKTGHGLSVAALVTNLAAGGALLLSLRSALMGSPWQRVSTWLMLALLAHLADLRMRWRRA